MKNHKILILLCYYERPNLVSEFLRSLLRANEIYQNWELVFIDDGSTKPGRFIAERILKDHLDQVKFFNSNMSPGMKKIAGGTYIGKYMNQAIKESDASVAIMAGDDDELYHDYLFNLNQFFQDRLDVMSCYSMVHSFNPLTETATQVNRLTNRSPGWKGHDWFGRPIHCANKVDGVQVAWRTKCCKVEGAWFPFPVVLNHDARFFEELNARCGKSEFTNFIAMYKGVHDDQLIKRINAGGAFGEQGVIDKPSKAKLF